MTIAKVDWSTRAACRGTDPELFYGHTEGVSQSSSEGRIAILQAKDRYCGRCPVKGECLEFAMKTNEKHGIWGGLTERERQSLRRQRQKEARQRIVNQRHGTHI